jgi:histidinol-phosphatase (PHP family)
MIRQNLHTHSVYCDGRDTIEDMVQTAVDLGFTDLGFSGHGYNQPLDICSMTENNQAHYMRHVKENKEAFKGRIRIWLGIEQDAIGRTFSHDDFDYIIGSVHYVPYKNTWKSVDESKEIFDELLEEYGSFLALAQAYYDQVKRLAAMDIDIVGHLDLLTKYNENQEYLKWDDPAYEKMAKEAIDILIDAGKIFEMNTGAIARGYRTTPYPSQNLLEYIIAKGGKLCINTDCHNRQNLDLGMKDCLARAKAAGCTKLMHITPEGFAEEDIDLFQ